MTTREGSTPGPLLGRRRVGSHRRAGAAGSLTLVLIASFALVWFLFVLRADFARAGYASIAADRARLDAGPGWVDPRWEEELRHRLAAHGDVSPDDRAAIERIRAELLELSFIESVGPGRVLWPDGLQFDVRMQAVVGCVRSVDGTFYPLGLDGTVLSGGSRNPPRCAQGSLPRILCTPDEDLRLRPGFRLESDAALDGIAVACGLWSHLRPEDTRRLGRATIDAREGRLASVTHGGVRLLLEASRYIELGRPPRVDAPGETPPEIKWAHVAKGLARLVGEGGEQPLDWVGLVARFDQPQYRVAEDGASGEH